MIRFETIAFQVTNYKPSDEPQKRTILFIVADCCVDIS